MPTRRKLIQRQPFSAEKIYFVMAGSSDEMGAYTRRQQQSIAQNKTREHTEESTPSTLISTSSQPSSKSRPSPTENSLTVSSVKTSETAASLPTEDDLKSSSTSDPVLREQAQKFLQDPSIRDAPKEEKMAFLESKGLRRSDISAILIDAPSLSSSITSTDQGTTSPSAPPILTYPEFLTNYSAAPGPPPLITAVDVLTLLTAVSTVTGFTYGAAKYILAPMTEQLASARHDLFTSAITKLCALNDKLSSAVSIVPPSPKKPPDAPHDPSQLSPHPHTASSTSSTDATEFFQRDISTQTSPPPSPSLPATHRHSASHLPSPSSIHTSTTISTPATSDPNPATTHQIARLRALSQNLSSLLSSTASIERADDSLSNTTADLRNWLEGIAYTNMWTTTHASNMCTGANVASAMTQNSISGSGVRAEDETMRLRAEIRSFKGALLSARNFPGAPAPGSTGIGIMGNSAARR